MGGGGLPSKNCMLVVGMDLRLKEVLEYVTHLILFMYTYVTIYPLTRFAMCSRLSTVRFDFKI